MKQFVMLVVGLSMLVLPLSDVEAHDFAWENLLLASIKLNPEYDYEEYVDSYMRKFRPTVWNRTRDDEFLFHDAREQSKAMFKKKVESFRADEEFVLPVSIRFGKYDFEKGAFPLQEMTENNYWYKSAYSRGSFPGRIKVWFDNTDNFRWMELDKDKARNLLASRKTRYGQTKRGLSATVRFKLKKLKNRNSELTAEITSIRVYADNTRTNMLWSKSLEKSSGDLERSITKQTPANNGK